MISRRIQCKPGNDNYGRLATYIADASHKGEKCMAFWTEGCWAGQDYDLAIQEVQDTQDLNQRTRKEKTYHLIISFRPEDEAQLNEERFKEIELEFARALGFEAHQRHCGVHKNTCNMHMHVAYNMIHPERLTRHEPYRDFRKRDHVCRALEKKYGLKIDNGRDLTDKGPKRENEKARTYEAHSGQQSFDGYVQERAEKLQLKIGLAKSWKKVHEVLAGHGLKMTPRGNGCVIKDRFGKQRVKASVLGRECSKKRLEARLGAFKPHPDIDKVKAFERYRAKPLHRDPERGKLYQEYETSIAAKKEQYEQIREEADGRLAEVRKKWKRKQREIRLRADLVWKDKKALISVAKLKGLKEEESVRFQATGQRHALREEYPFHNWNGFLKMKADDGNEVALAILRSKEVTVEDREVKAPERRLEGVTHRVDNQGNVLYTLAGGGMVKDTGKELFFSASDDKAKKVAEQLAMRKFGKRFGVEGNRIRVKKSRKKQVEITRG